MLRHYPAPAATCGWLLLLLLTSAHVTSAHDPTLDPATLRDSYGNQADADSVVTWAELAIEEYSEIKDYDDGQLRGLLNMKDGFVDALQKDPLDTGELW